MNREDRFLISRRPYAIDLTSLDCQPNGYARVSSVWFRRRRGDLVACTGYLWDFQATAPTTALEFLKRHDDGRYGGTTLGRWDGEGYWGEENPDEVAAHLDLLRPMLDNFPAVPSGFDGWWTFR